MTSIFLVLVVFVALALYARELTWRIRLVALVAIAVLIVSTMRY